jgi:hypothetical protein
MRRLGHARTWCCHARRTMVTFRRYAPVIFYFFEKFGSADGLA